jgi:hypothetical protein
MEALFSSTETELVFQAAGEALFTETFAEEVNHVFWRSSRGAV